MIAWELSTRADSHTECGKQKTGAYITLVRASHFTLSLLLHLVLQLYQRIKLKPSRLQPATKASIEWPFHGSIRIVTDVTGKMVVTVMLDGCLRGMMYKYLVLWECSLVISNIFHPSTPTQKPSTIILDQSLSKGLSHIAPDDHYKINSIALPSSKTSPNTLPLWSPTKISMVQPKHPRKELP